MESLATIRNPRHPRHHPGAAFTPDGRELVTNLNGKLVSRECGVRRSLEHPVQLARSSRISGLRVYSESRVEEGPVQARLIRWPQQSPDGRRLVFSALSKLYVMDLPDRQPRRLTNAHVGEFSPVWSPDGRSIAYVTWAPEGGHIWKIAATAGRHSN